MTQVKFVKFPPIINGTYMKDTPNSQVGFQKFEIEKIYTVRIRYEVVHKTKDEADQLVEKEHECKVDDYLHACGEPYPSEIQQKTYDVETEDEAFAEDLDRRVVEILSHSATLELSEGLIEEYECLYEENNNVFLSSEKTDSVDDGDTEFESPDLFDSAEPIEVIPYKEPNVVQKDALEILDC